MDNRYKAKTSAIQRFNSKFHLLMSLLLLRLRRPKQSKALSHPAVGLYLLRGTLKKIQHTSQFYAALDQLNNLRTPEISPIYKL